VVLRGYVGMMRWARHHDERRRRRFLLSQFTDRCALVAPHGHTNTPVNFSLRAELQQPVSTGEASAARNVEARMKNAWDC
jgi:hypothetical protein